MSEPLSYVLLVPFWVAILFILYYLLFGRQAEDMPSQSGEVWDTKLGWDNRSAEETIQSLKDDLDCYIPDISSTDCLPRKFNSEGGLL